MDRATNLLVVLALIAVTFGVYAPVRHFDFVQLDDPAYVTENPQVIGGVTGSGVAWALTTGHAANWHPVTWLSHMLDVQLFGVAPGPHHVVNLALHLANVLLLFYVLLAMTGARWRSAFVAALFAVHPLHVESVAWVAERKDVLSTFFLMLTLAAYVRHVGSPGFSRGTTNARSTSPAAPGLPAYARDPGRELWRGLAVAPTDPDRRGGGKPGGPTLRYLLVVLFFALGLMAKPMLVTLPFVLLLLDVWPLGRLRTLAALWPLVREKLPLFAMALLSCAATVVAQQRGGAVGALEAFPLGLRVENAVVSLVAYLRSMIWPAGLTMLYSFPDSIAPAELVLALLVLAAISFVAVRAAGRHPYVLVGWLWYLGTLVPVVGIVQVGLQARADRYTYVPLIGIFIIIAWGVEALLVRGRPWAKAQGTYIVLGTLGAVTVIACSVTARAQVGYWKDNVTLFTHATMVTLGQDEYQAHMSLGTTLGNQGRLDEATSHFAEAVRLRPESDEARVNLGIAYAKASRRDDALREFTEAVRLNPANEMAQRAVDSLRATGAR